MRHHSQRSREGSHSSHSNGGSTRPRRNYKLISDPYIDPSFSEKSYRFEGVVSGHSPIADPVDPRARGGRFVLGAKEFPVPRFVYDKFSIGDPPQRDLFISGINDNLREDDIMKMCQKIGEVHSVEVYYHPERKAHLGAATVCFLKSSVALRALEELNGKKAMGQCLQVQVDDNGDIAADYKKSKLSSTQSIIANTQPNQRRPSDPRSAVSTKPVPSPLPLQPPTPLFPPAELLATLIKANPFLPNIIANIATSQPQEKAKPSEYQPNSLEERLEKLKVQGVFPIPLTLSPPPPPPPAFDPSQLLSCESPYKFLTPPILLNLPPPPPPAASPPAPPPPLPKSRKKSPTDSKHKPEPTDSKDRSRNSKHSSRSKRRSPTPSKSAHRNKHAPRDRDKDRGRDRDRDKGRDRVKSREKDRESSRYKSRERDRGHNRGREDRDRYRSPSSHRQTSKRSRGYPPMSHASFNIRPTPPLSHASILAPGHKKSHAHKRHLNHSSRHSTPSKHETGYQAISDVSSDENSESAKSHTSDLPREKGAPAGEEDMELDTDASETAPVIEMFQPQQQGQQQGQQLDLQQNVVLQLYLQTILNNNHLQLPLAALASLNNSQQQIQPPAYPPQTPAPSSTPPPPSQPRTDTSYRDLDPGALSELLQRQLPPGPVTLPGGSVGGWNKRRQLGPMYPVPKTFSEDVSNRVLFCLVQELRAVLCKDISKRLIEQTAYKGLEKYWEPQDTRLDIYGPLARKGGSSSGSKSQELPSPLKSEGETSKHRGSSGTGVSMSPSRVQPPARFKIPLLARRSLSNMNRGRRPESRGGSGATGGTRQKWRDREENESSPERKKEKQRKPLLKRFISSSPEPDAVLVEKSGVSNAAKFVASSSSSSSGSNSSSSSGSSSSSSDYSSDSESEHTSFKHSPPPSSHKEEGSSVKDSIAPDGHKIDTLIGGEERTLSPDPPPSFLPPTKQKSSPHEDSDSDLGAIYSPPPPAKPDGPYSWILNGAVEEKGPTWFSANDPASWSKDPAFLKKYAPALRRQQPNQTRRFPRRHPWEQIRVRDRFLEEGGFDEEDTKMLQYAYVRMKSDNSPLLRTVNYAYHPLRPEVSRPAPPLEDVSPLVKRKRNHKNIPQLSSRDHLSGSVRTEGLYRLSLQEKLIQRGKLGNTERLRGWKENFDVIQTSRDCRATQRRLATELGWADINSDIAKNLLRTRKKMLCFAKSTIHNWGLFTLEPIAVDELVIEYIGECIRSSIGDVRERRYQEVGIGCSYMFRVDSDYIIDATKKGNLARFINHSCDPNCYAKIIPVGTEKRIAIYSKRDIEVNEEITYDYKFPLEDEKIPCYCGAATCRGSLN